MGLLTLDTARLEQFERSAALLACLAYPAPRENYELGRLFLSYCGLQIDCENNIARTTAPFSVERMNGYGAIDPKKAVRFIKPARRRFEHRRAAAQVARPWTHQFITGHPHRPVDGLKKFTPTAIAGKLFGPARAGNFLSRQWKRSLPVIHVAMAIDQYIEENLGVPSRRSCAIPSSVPLPLDDPGYDQIARHAMRIQRQIAANRTFGLTKSDLVWIDLKD